MAQPSSEIPASKRGGVPTTIDEWLPADFKPMTFPQLMWAKLKAAPLVGVGMAATVASFCMATYSMKLGNSRKFNYWLRWRVASQGATILAAVWYGGVAFTAEQQQDYYHRNLLALGDYRVVRPNSSESESESKSDSDRASTASTASTGADPSSSGSTENSPYPPPVEERPRLSEFATRLRQAEAAHKAENEALAKGETSGGGTVADRLRRRADKERQQRLAQSQAAAEQTKAEQTTAEQTTAEQTTAEQTKA